MLRLGAACLSRRLTRVCIPTVATSRPLLVASWRLRAAFSSSAVSESSVPAAAAVASTDAKLSLHETVGSAASALGGAAPILSPTAKAIERLRFLATKAGNSRLMLRVAVYEGGCHGMEYKFKLEHDDSALEPDDTVIEVGEGARFVLDAVTVEKMRGSTVDYLQDLQGEMFAVVHNPLASAACGCGSSFSPKA